MSHVLATARGNVELRGANPYAEWGVTAPPAPGSVGGSVGGLHVTQESATQVAAVYGCVGLLADSIASLPLRVLDKPATVNTAKELAVPSWLERPYEEISLTDWIVNFIWSLALRGNFFGWVTKRNDLGYPTQIMPVNPDIVKAHQNPQGVMEWWIAKEKVRPEDVFHVRYQSVPGTLLGLNPIQMMRYPFGLAHVTDVHAANFFANSANPQGVLQAKRKLTEDAAKKLASAWKTAHQGPNQGSMPAILDQETEWKGISISPADQQLLESRKWSAEEIAGMVFRIPPHMIGLTERSTSFGRGIEQQERTFVSNTLVGYKTRFDRALTECLPKGQFVDLDLRQRLRGDSLQRAEIGYKLILCGAWCGDDVRETYDMPPAPEGQGKIFHSPTNSELLDMQQFELEQAEKESKEPKPQPVLPGAPGEEQQPPGKQPPPPKGGKGVARMLAELRSLARSPQPIEIHNHLPAAGDVHVEPAHVEVGGPEVRVEPQIAVPEQHVTVAPAEVHVAPAEVRVEPHIAMPESLAPEVHVEVEPTPVNVRAPNVRVDAPTVNVEAPNVTVEPPNVNVEAPEVNVNVEAPEVNVKPTLKATLKPSGGKRVERDKTGQITRVVEE